MAALVGEVNVVTLSETLIKHRKVLQLRTLNLSKNLLSGAKMLCVTAHA